MAEPGGTGTGGTGGENPSRADEGRKLIRDISLDVSPAEESLKGFSDKLKAFETALSKQAEALTRSAIIVDRLNADISKLHSLILSATYARQASIRAMEMAMKASEEQARKMAEHARATSQSADVLERLISRYRRLGTVVQEFEDATREYVLNIASLAFLPYAAFKGLYDSINEVIGIARSFRDDLIAFDRAVVSSIRVLNRWAERGGVRGRVARALRRVPVAYARLTRGIPRRVARAVRGIRAPRITDFLRSIGWVRWVGEMAEEQKGMRRLLAVISGGIGLITGLFNRLLRYVWEMLLLQKLGALFKGVGDLLKGALASALGSSIATKIASALSGVAASISGALSTAINSAMGVVGGVVAGITVAGKIGEALGVSAGVIERASSRIREKADEAEKHGNAIASAFYNASASILDFSRQLWEAGDQAKQWLSTHVPVIGGALGEIAQGFLHGVSLLVSANAMVSNFLGDVSTRLSGLAGWLRDNVSSFIANMGNALNGFVSWARNQLQNAWNGFTNTLKSTLDTVINAVSGAWDKITGFFKGIADKLGLGGVVQSLSNMVSNAFKGVADALSSFGKALTGRNPGVITHLEELGSSLRNVSDAVAGLSIRPAGGDQYSPKIVDLLAELIEEVRMLREEASRARPEVNVNIKASEGLYLRRR